MKTTAKKNTIIFFILLYLFAFKFSLMAQVIKTNEWVNFYSTNTLLAGEPIPVDGVINAFDPAGTHCGTFTVSKQGQYGFLPVYRDDPLTPDIDEGALPGDTITFTINDIPAKTLGPKANIWTFNGDVIELNLATNRAPAIADTIKNVIMNEDDPALVIADLDSIFYDPDNDSLRFSSQGNAAFVKDSIDNENRVMIVLAANWHGKAELILTADDGWDVVCDTILVTVLPVNDPPVISAIADTNATEGSLFSMQVSATDVDSGQVISFYDNTPLFDIDALNGIISFTPTNDAVGKHEITITVSDGSLADSARFMLCVLNLNDLPVVQLPDTLAFPEDGIGSFDLDLFVTDVDDPDSLIIWEFGNTRNINITINSNDHIATLKATENWFGSENVIFIATDTSGASSRDTLTVLVLPVNDPPVIASMPDVEFRSDTIATLDLNEYVSDVDDSDAELNWMALVESGIKDSLQVTIDNAAQIATFHTLYNFHGLATVIFIVTDDSLAADRDTISVRVEHPTGIMDKATPELPDQYKLGQNYPNPFNPTTTIYYQLPGQCHTIVKIYNAIGRQVATLVDEQQKAGFYSIIWNADGQTSGVYFVWITAGTFSAVRKMLLIR